MKIHIAMKLMDNNIALKKGQILLQYLDPVILLMIWINKFLIKKKSLQVQFLWKKKQWEVSLKFKEEIQIELKETLNKSWTAIVLNRYQWYRNWLGNSRLLLIGLVHCLLLQILIKCSTMLQLVMEIQEIVKTGIVVDILW